MGAHEGERSIRGVEGATRRLRASLTEPRGRALFAPGAAKALHLARRPGAPPGTRGSLRRAAARRSIDLGPLSREGRSWCQRDSAGLAGPLQPRERLTFRGTGSQICKLDSSLLFGRSTPLWASRRRHGALSAQNTENLRVQDPNVSGLLGRWRSARRAQASARSGRPVGAQARVRRLLVCSNRVSPLRTVCAAPRCPTFLVQHRAASRHITSRTASPR